MTLSYPASIIVLIIRLPLAIVEFILIIILSVFSFPVRSRCCNYFSQSARTIYLIGASLDDSYLLLSHPSSVICFFPRFPVVLGFFCFMSTFCSHVLLLALNQFYVILSYPVSIMVWSYRCLYLFSNLFH